jgi:hypothetical protein
MKVATSLTLLAIGAILAFAVNSSPSFVNLQIVGVIVMAAGVAGLVIPRRGQQGWLRRRIVLRRGARGPVVGHVEETKYPPYIMVNPDSVRGQTDGLPEPGDLTSTIPDGEAAEQPAHQAPAATDTEVVEEYLQE